MNDPALTQRVAAALLRELGAQQVMDTPPEMASVWFVDVGPVGAKLQFEAIWLWHGLRINLARIAKTQATPFATGEHEQVVQSAWDRAN